MNLFSLPADFRIETIEKYSELNKKINSGQIIETYGQLTDKKFITGSGRTVSEIPKASIEELEKYVSFSREKNIAFNYTLNSLTLGNLEFDRQGIVEIFRLLEQLHSIGITSLTVALPTIIDIVKKSPYDFKIKTSVLCNVDSPNKIKHYKDLGIERVVVSSDIIRNASLLKSLVEVFGDGVEVIVNDTCFTDCPYKIFHFNATACNTDGKEELIKDYFVNRCHVQKFSDLKNFMLLNWIRPEDLHYYSDIGIHYFKIQGRQFVNQGNPVKTAECYLNEQFEGNLYELLNLFYRYNSFNPLIDNSLLDGFFYPFFNNPEFCKKNCYKCNYCKKWANKCINYKKEEDIAKKALYFYTERDLYNRGLTELSLDKSSINSKFNFEKLSKESD